MGWRIRVNCSREVSKGSQRRDSSAHPECSIPIMDRALRISAAFVKLFLISVIVASMIATSVNCEQASSRRLLQTVADPPEAESPQFAPARSHPGCSLGPVCLAGSTIICENDAETGETGGCICGLVHACHPERVNCTLYTDSNPSGTPCGF